MEAGVTDSWGGAWGSAWLAGSWGGSPSPEPEAPSTGGGSYGPRQPTRFDQRRDEEELLMIVSAAFVILNAQ